MSLSLYQSSVPVFERSLNAFLGILDKAEEHAEARKFDASSYLAIRLSPDMWPLAPPDPRLLRSRQELVVQARGQGEPPAIEDKETTIAEIRQRIKTTLDLLKSIDATAMDGARIARSSCLPAPTK